MGESGGATMRRLEVGLTPAERAALAAAAKQPDLSASTLARALIVLCVERLARGDAELQRAVKGSRDAGCR